MFRVNVANSDNVLAHDVPDVIESFATDTDTDDIELFTRRDLPRAAQHVPRNNRKRSHWRCGTDDQLP